MALAHAIEAAPIENRYARGWHCLGLAEDYRDGKPHTLNAFGTRLVAYLGEDPGIQAQSRFLAQLSVARDASIAQQRLNAGFVFGDRVSAPCRAGIRVTP